jgi:DNA-binding transcriptional ArsR family regulator
MAPSKKRRRGSLVSAPFPAVLAALASEKRRGILLELAQGPRGRRALAEALGLSTSSVVHHLKRLCDHGLVRVDRRGSQLRYRLGRQVSAIVGREKAILNVVASDGCGITLTIPVSDQYA